MGRLTPYIFVAPRRGFVISWVPFCDPHQQVGAAAPAAARRCRRSVVISGFFSIRGRRRKSTCPRDRWRIVCRLTHGFVEIAGRPAPSGSSFLAFLHRIGRLPAPNWGGRHDPLRVVLDIQGES